MLLLLHIITLSIVTVTLSVIKCYYEEIKNELPPGLTINFVKEATEVLAIALSQPLLQKVKAKKSGETVPIYLPGPDEPPQLYAEGGRSDEK